jgi:hypothetical protein
MCCVQILQKGSNWHLNFKTKFLSLAKGSPWPDRVLLKPGTEGS